MPSLVIRCHCGKTPRYALPSQQRIARDTEGKAIIKDGEPVVEMAYRCRGGHIFHHADVKSSVENLPTEMQRVLKIVLENKAKATEDKV